MGVSEHQRLFHHPGGRLAEKVRSSSRLEWAYLSRRSDIFNEGVCVTKGGILYLPE